MEAKFTPGPWVFQKHHNPSEWLGNIVGSYGENPDGIEMIRTITCQTKYGTPEEQQANANLMTASPDMYEALVVIAKEIPEFTALPSHIEHIIDAALAKAKGEQ